MVAPVVAAAGITAAGGVLGQFMANRANRHAANRQMDFQREMSDTAHQRQVADLKAAGLNPALSASLGGSSAPGGASSTSQDVLGGPISSAVSTLRTAAEIKNMMAQSGLIEANTRQADAMVGKVLSDTAYNQTLAAKTQADTAVARDMLNTAATNRRLANAQTAKVAQETTYGPGYLGTVGRLFNMASSALGNKTTDDLTRAFRSTKVGSYTVSDFKRDVFKRR